ncbi:MAG: HD-GYP domain-containing protein [Phycisphaerales bacterium]
MLQSTAASRRSRVRWVAIVVGVQAVFLALGWALTARYVRHTAEAAVAQRLNTLGVATDGAMLPGSWARDLPLVSVAVGLIVLSCTGLITARLMRRHDGEMDGINAGLEREVRRRVAHSLRIRTAMITGLARLADYRDTDTGAHLDRIAEYSVILARALRPRFAEIDDEWIAMLRTASTLHDIGKVGVADAVLLKPGPLTAEERSHMQIHPVIGSDTLIAAREQMGSDPLVEMSIRVAMYHHERWDGNGYPVRIAGEEIPLEARIVSVADVYDALTSRRVYKDALPHARAVEVIVAASGSQFDGDVVAALVAVEGEMDAARRGLSSEGGVG